MGGDPRRVDRKRPDVCFRHESVGEVAPLAARGLIGGIFVTHRNAAGRSLDQLRDEIAQPQRLRRDAGLPPLIVAADQEGGIVSHLSPPLPAHAPLSDLAGLPPNVRRAKARKAGEALGAELADLSVTVDFAPVVDLRFFERRADASDNGSRRLIQIAAPYDAPAGATLLPELHPNDGRPIIRMEDGADSAFRAESELRFDQPRNFARLSAA
ncbi:glycoside hydrolase family 3 N-terminal domain-containing protein [Methylosinus sporium]|nr:glycoside hydrolase family 3 N-terminal domain-containing protein [Methylosinus sporium]